MKKNSLELNKFFNQRFFGNIIISIGLLLLCACKFEVSKIDEISTVGSSNNPTEEYSLPKATNIQVVLPTKTSFTSHPETIITPSKTPIISIEEIYNNFEGILAFLGVENPQEYLTPHNFDLFLRYEDGSIEKVTEDSVVQSFSWSPNGKKIVFSAITNFISYDLFIYDIDDKTINKVDIPIVGDTNLFDPCWSSDGDKISFVQWVEGEYNLYFYDLKSHTIEYIENGRFPTWHPVNQSITYIGILEDDFFGKLSQYLLDDEIISYLLEDYVVSSPSWSTNGEFLSFIQKSNWHYAYSINEKELVPFSHSKYPSSWLPNEELILYIDSYDVNNNHLYIYDVNNDSHLQVYWIPENYFIAYIEISP